MVNITISLDKAELKILEKRSLVSTDESQRQYLTNILKVK